MGRNSTEEEGDALRARIERICVTEEWVRRLSWIQEAMKTRAGVRGKDQEWQGNRRGWAEWRV